MAVIRATTADQLFAKSELILLSFNILTYDAEKAGRRWTLVNDLFGTFIIDVHCRITSVSDVADLHGIPVNEQAAEAILDAGPWGADTGVRTEALRTWSGIARQALPEPHSIWYRIRALPGVIFVFCLVGLLLVRLKTRLLAHT